MAYAASNDFVVPIHDLDFSAIFAVTRGQKPSVVQIRSENLSPEHIGHQIITALLQMTSELQDGALVTVTPNARDSAFCHSALGRIDIPG